MKMKTFFKLVNEQVTEMSCLTKQAEYWQAESLETFWVDYLRV